MADEGYLLHHRMTAIVEPEVRLAVVIPANSVKIISVSLLCTFSSQHSASRSVSVQSRDPDCDTHLSRISKNSLVSLLSSCQWRGCSSLGFDYLDIGIQN